MKKKMILLVVFLLFIGSLSVYLFLSAKIISGNLRVAAGENELKQGEQKLANGKVRLARGKQQLSEANTVYTKTKPGILAWAATALPVVGTMAVYEGNKIAKNKISRGKQEVAQGNEKIKAGEKQLAAGQEELEQGKEKLSLANKIRNSCGVGTIVFLILFLILGVVWRKTWLKRH